MCASDTTGQNLRRLAEGGVLISIGTPLGKDGGRRMRALENSSRPQNNILSMLSLFSETFS
jgi:hypothetical protein